MSSARDNNDYPSNFDAKQITSAMNQADAALSSATQFMQTRNKTEPKSQAGAGAGTPPNAVPASLPDWTAGKPSPINTAHQGGPAATSVTTPGSRNLDLSHNDNSFHVIASLVVDRFENQLKLGAPSLQITRTDREQLDRMVPERMRTNLVDAVAFRLQSCPEDSMQSIHILLRKCRSLGLDREGSQNVLMAPVNTVIPITRGSKPQPLFSQQSVQPSVAALSVQQGSVNPPLMQQPTFPTSNLPPTSNMPPATSKMPPATSKMPPATSNMPPATSNMPPATSNMPPASSKPPSSVAAGTVGSASVLTMGNTTVNNGTPESLARRQLMAELKEASNLMAESVTPEAATFWRNHVVELQARLRALHGDGTSQVHPSVLGGLAAEGLAAEGLAAEEILENSERLLTSLEHEEEESISGYKPPSQYQQQKQHEMSTPRFQPQVTLNDVDPSIGSPMVDVVAPADLPGGYTFEAEIEDRRFLAIVPKGGVRKGETFSCFMRDLSKVGSEVPVGRWRDSLTSCFVHGICHPNVLNALWCPLLALGQIMTRVGLDFMGNPAGAARKKGGVTPWGVMGVVVIFWTTINLAVFGAFNYKWSRGMELSAADWTSLAVVNTAGVLFTIYAVASTRASVREKYLIRESRFLDLEDCCCATFCMPCTICQMSRHTASYNDHEGICCNARGYRINNRGNSLLRHNGGGGDYIV